jgi:hypothetical protein
MSEAINFNDEIDRLLDRDPFVPFKIILTSGDRYEITGPRQVAMGDNVVVVVPSKSTHSFFRKNQIVGVEVAEPAQ